MGMLTLWLLHFTTAQQKIYKEGQYDSSNQQKNFIDFAMWFYATLGPHSKQPKRLSLNSCVLLMKAVDWILLKLL